MGDGKVPCSTEEAIRRMVALSKIADSSYQLGTGSYNPHGFTRQYDCAGAICEAFELARHRPGFASGRPQYADQNDVDDDINTNSMLEDASGPRDLFEPVLEGPVLPGDLVMWATVTIKGEDGHSHVFIGHVLMVYQVPEGWDPSQGWHRVRMLQCCGGNGRKPAVIETDGSVIDRHNTVWPKPAHRAYVVRVKQLA